MPVPRSSPVPRAEKEIGARVAEARRQHGLSRISFAEGMFPDASALVRIELGRVPLRYLMARKFWQKMPQLNPLFLSAGKAPLRLELPLWLPQPKDIDVPHDALFSAVIERYSTELMTLLGPKETHRLPPSWIPAQRFYLDLLRFKAHNEELKIRGFSEWIDQLEASGQEKRTSLLTEAETRSNVAGVKSPLKSLVADVNRLASKPGKKSELAKFLKAPPASVSRWLSGEREPGGETTLKLLEWVEQQKR